MKSPELNSDRASGIAGEAEVRERGRAGLGWQLSRSPEHSRHWVLQLVIVIISKKFLVNNVVVLKGRERTFACLVGSSEWRATTN